MLVAKVIKLDQFGRCELILGVEFLVSLFTGSNSSSCYHIPLDLPPGGAKILCEDRFGRLSSIWTPVKKKKTHTLEHTKVSQQNFKWISGAKQDYPRQALIHHMAMEIFSPQYLDF